MNYAQQKAETLRANQKFLESMRRGADDNTVVSDPLTIPPPPNGLEFMAKKFPPRKKALGPFTTSALVHAAGDTGVGKTMCRTTIR